MLLRGRIVEPAQSQNGTSLMETPESSEGLESPVGAGGGEDAGAPGGGIGS